MLSDFNWSPMMFWQDITYVIGLIIKIFKKLFGLDKDEDVTPTETVKSEN